MRCSHLRSMGNGLQSFISATTGIPVGNTGRSSGKRGIFAAHRASSPEFVVIVDAAGRVTVIAALQKITVAVVVATGCQNRLHKTCI